MCSAEGDATFELPELAGNNRFTFSAQDDRGLVSRALVVDAQGPSTARPDLWIVGVGVSAYPNLAAENQLRAAHLDARAVVLAFGAQAGPGRPFANAHPVTLVDEDVSVESIRWALGGLAAMGEDDLAVVFLAGHGVKVSDASDMRFLTRNARASTSSVAAEGIGWSEIASMLGAARGRVLLLLDACHAGHLSQELIVPNGALAAKLSQQGRAGVLVFAAAKGRQESLEDRDDGYFTRAILDTLADPTADRDHDGRIEVSELIDSVTLRVDVRTHGRQTPWVTRRELFGDFQNRCGGERGRLGAMSTTPSHAQIALRAYERYAARGYQNGHDVDDWYAAEASLLAGAITPAHSTPAPEHHEHHGHHHDHHQHGAHDTRHRHGS